MVDVGRKPVTERRAIAAGEVRMRPETVARLVRGDAPKGEVLATARLAAIMAAKRTHETIPLCHPVALTHVEVAIEPGEGSVRVRAIVDALDRTGCEMEAMVAVTTACLTIYDMLKGIDRDMVIAEVHLLEKSGGRSGHYRRGAAPRANRIRASVIGLDEVVRDVAHAGAGGVATFLGVVRDVNDGRPVTLLEYEAYGTMAEAELSRILDELRAEIPGVRAAALHRVGPLAIGEVAVACAASAPHRDEAFRACRALIDRIKARLPIWKREHGPDGPSWVGWEDARCGHDGHPHAGEHET